MSSTTFAHQVAAAAAAGARPCDVSGHGYRWRSMTGLEMGTLFMNQIAATKRPARRLGKQPT